MTATGRFCSALGVALLFVVMCALPCRADEGWVSLFNGKNLDGWIPKIKGYDLGDNHGDTFRVEDGLLKVSYENYKAFDSKFGHLHYEKPHSNYRLRLEYRFTGEQCPGGPGWATRNSGIMVHGEDPKLMEKDQDFPSSIEVQLLGGDGKNDRTTGNLCTPGTNVVMDDKLVTRHCISAKSKTFHGEQWVKSEVEVRGNEVIRHLINGDVVLEYQKPQLDPKDEHAKSLISLKDGNVLLSGGFISLQSESHPVEFRKIEIKVLD